MRILLFTGKGGVGKTTIAAATALRAAQAGHRTLITSTDPAHSLADSFDVVLGDEVSEIRKNLWAEQIDAQSRLEANWRDIQEYIVSFLNWAGIDAIEAEELSVIPGLDEIFSLTDVKRHVDSGLFDLLVIDCAPTAETLRLLSLPEVMNWYIERIFPVERKVVKTIRPILTRITTMPIAEDRIFAAVERLHRNLEGVGKLLRDEERASVRLVVNPEEMVGFDLLKLMGDDVYEDADATKVLHHDEPIRVQKRGPWYVLSLQLPFTDRTQLDIHRKAEELVVRVGSYKRTLILPHALQRLEIREARFVEDRLEIRFREKEGTGPARRARKAPSPSEDERGRKHG